MAHALGARRREWWWLALIVGAGLALRAAAIVGFSHVPESDELAYKSMALNLVQGHGIIDDMGNRAMYNVGYPLFVLTPVFYLFGENLSLVRSLHLALGGVSVALCYLVAKEAGAGRIGRLLAAAIWALYLPASIYGVYLLKENLMIPLMLGVMWCALRLATLPSTPVALLCGALFGLLALTGNAALALVAAALLAIGLAPSGTTRKLSLAGALLVAALAVSAPWMLRNMQVLGAPVMNTNGGFNLYLGNNPAATGMFISIGDTPRGKSWNALRQLGEIQASNVLKEDAIAWIEAHPAEFVALALKKAVYFWTPPVHEGKGSASAVEKAVRLMWAAEFIALVAAALCSLFFARLRSRKLAVLWIAIASYTTVHMLFYVIFRYREPVMPILGVIAALAIESLVRQVRGARGSSEALGA